MSDENREVDETKNEQSSTDDENKEEDKRVRINLRRTKFDPSLVRSKDKGLDALWKSLKKFDPDNFTSETEALVHLLRIYQIWAHSIYPSTFEDVITKVSNIRGIRNDIRDKVYEYRGEKRPSYDYDLGSKAIPIYSSTSTDISDYSDHSDREYLNNVPSSANDKKEEQADKETKETTENKFSEILDLLKEAD